LAVSFERARDPVGPANRPEGHGRYFVP
jgi:hypothetical protein